MSEIRGKVISKVSDLIQHNYQKKASWEIAEAILSIPELAIVDREAREICGHFIKREENYPFSPRSYFDKAGMEKGCPLLEAGYIKEVLGDG